MKNLSKKEVKLLYNMVARDAHAEKALFTKEEERTPYQKSLMALWNKLTEAEKSD